MNGVVPNVAPESITIGVDFGGVVKAPGLVVLGGGTLERNSEMYAFQLRGDNSLEDLDRN